MLNKEDDNNKWNSTKKFKQIFSNYQNNEIANIDNGKIIMYKDVNNIFGYETIYKNYIGRNKKNNKTNIFPKSKSTSCKSFNKLSISISIPHSFLS